MTDKRLISYRVATAAILGGFIMLIQPLSQDLFRLGLPVMIVGIVLHAVLDHLPDRTSAPGGRPTSDGRKP
jgi:hypothetical protein